MARKKKKTYAEKLDKLTSEELLEKAKYWDRRMEESHPGTGVHTIAIEALTAIRQSGRGQYG